MKIRNTQYGHSFEMNSKQASEFLHSKNARGRFINLNDYEVIKESKISDTKFYLTCIGLIVLTVASVLLHINLNY